LLRRALAEVSVEPEHARMQAPVAAALTVAVAIVPAVLR
jgi:hypothetical protein